jgi:hypothetical protein
MIISQATYDRLCNARVPSTDDRGRELRFAPQDVRDLLRAFEEAIELLDECQNAGIEPRALREQVEDHLYRADGEPRIVLEGV